MFQPVSAHNIPEISLPPVISLDYHICDADPGVSKPAVSVTAMAMSDEIYATMIRHAFATSGPKSKPIHVEVNGREGRRAVCVLYGDSLRYDVLDLDAAMKEGEDEDGEGHNEETKQ